MNFVNLIQNKKQGINHTEEEIKYIVSSVNNGLTDDSQLSAWLMAVNFRGLVQDEILYLIKAIAASSNNIVNSELETNITAYITTGGVGDKVSLALLPLLAASGINILDAVDKNCLYVKNSADRIESVSGVVTELSELAIINQIKNINAAFVSYNDNISYFLNKLSYLMSINGTADSDVLVAILILTKLIISGAQFSLIDVKYGSGTAIKTVEDALHTATLISNVIKALDKNALLVVTSAEEPIGRTIGSSLEVIEAIEFLKGNSENNEFSQLVYNLASLVLFKLGRSNNIDDSIEYLKETVKSGKALEYFGKILHSQGANVEIINDYDKFVLPCYKIECVSKKSGFVQNVDASYIQKAMEELEAVRTKLNSEVDYTVGIYLNIKRGEYVNQGDTIFTIYSNDNDRTKKAQELCDLAFTIGESKPSSNDIIYKVIGIEDEDV